MNAVSLSSTTRHEDVSASAFQSSEIVMNPLLQEIHRLRTTREELVRLLGRSGAIGAVDNSTKIFESFRGVAALRHVIKRR